ncbi:hypothetical protein M493_03940 [Geobacillus genomosp. 3]|uniref:Uncharacterized protein n=1 Tax=Geobacillus genomosp. 3 TaxID=1921421 RepID=S5YWK9_GEOG3|nr:hypothetical protein M493_03940 [Geobacillus genomosp. 3]
MVDGAWRRHFARGGDVWKALNAAKNVLHLIDCIRSLVGTDFFMAVFVIHAPLGQENNIMMKSHF